MSHFDEPVRGGYPPPAILSLAGAERLQLRPPFFPPPPIHHLMGLTPDDEDRLTFHMPASAWLASAPGVFFAGSAALVADAPLGSAVLTCVPPQYYAVTSELSLNYLRPATIGSGELVARARLIDAGRTLGLSEAVVQDARGRMLAHTTSRYFLLRAPIEVKRPDEFPASPMPRYDTPDPYERALDWDVPAAELAKMDGMEFAQACLTGDIPPAPFARLFGIRVVDAAEGRFVCSMPASEWLNSPARTIYGGIQAFALDTVLIGAVWTTVPAGSSCASLDLKVQFLRPGIADGRTLTLRAEVVHRGRSLAIARAELLNADGKQLAIATGSVMVREGRPWEPVSVADEAPDEGETR